MERTQTYNEQTKKELILVGEKIHQFALENIDCAIDWRIITWYINYQYLSILLNMNCFTNNLVCLAYFKTWFNYAYLDMSSYLRALKLSF